MNEIEKAKAIFKAWSGKECSSLTSIRKGTGNGIFIIEDQYLCRIKRVNLTDASFYSESNEKSIIEAINQFANITPQLLYFQNGSKIENYIHGVSKFEIKSQNSIQNAVYLIKELNKIKGDFLFFDPLKRYMKYRESGKNAPLDYEREISLVQVAISTLQKYPMVLCHNDLCDGNIIFGQEGNYLIDFEFAGINYSLFDLCSLIEENSLNEAKALEAIKAYDTERIRQIEIDVKNVNPFLSLLWFYWAEARYKETGKKVFAKIAKEKRGKLV